MTETVVVVDVGSSSLRAGLFDTAGACLRRVARAVPLRAHGDVSEVAAAELWAVTCDAIASLDAAQFRVAAVGVTAALGILLTREDGAPVSDIVTWQDRRAQDEAAETVRRVGEERLQIIAGRRIAPELLAPILLWFRAHRPDQFRAAALAPSMKDWLVHCLCGAWVTDATSASYTLLYDVTRGCWSDEVIDPLSLRNLRLGPVRGAAEIAGGLRAEVARSCGLRPGTPVIVGGPDGTVAGVGAGMTGPGIAVDVMGTTDVVFAYTGRPDRDAERRLVLNRFVTNDAWTIGGPLAATGGVVSWLLRLTGSTLDALSEAASGIPPAADGVTFFPMLGGSRTPRWQPTERGMIAGLSFDHGAPHLFRALLEGCAIEVAEVFDELAACGVAVNEIRGVGGGTASDLWMRIRASVLDRPILVPDALEASSLGTVMLCAVAVGWHADLSEAAARMVRCSRLVAPVADWVAPYRALRRRYAALRERADGR